MKNRWIAALTAAAVSVSLLSSGIAFAEEETGTEEAQAPEFGDLLGGLLGASGLSGLIEDSGIGAEAGIGALGSELAEALQELGGAVGEGFGQIDEVLNGNMENLTGAIVDGLLELTDEDRKPTVYPLTVENSDGTETVIEEEPQRIVSVSPSLTEIIFALDAGEKLIARSDYCNYPEEVLALESVGQIYGADIEKILSLEPDLVVASAHFPEESISQLADAGIKVVYLYDENSSEGALKIVTTMGEILNRRPEGRKAAAIMAGRIGLTSLYVYAEEPVSLYYVVGYGEYGDYTATGDTYINELLTLAGAKNIAADAEGWSYSVEKLLEEDPEVILVPEYAFDDFIVTDPYTELTAVKEGRVIAVNNDLLDRQCPRNADIVVELAQQLHPEVFEKMEKDEPKVYAFLTGASAEDVPEEESAAEGAAEEEAIAEESAEEEATAEESAEEEPAA